MRTFYSLQDIEDLLSHGLKQLVIDDQTTITGPARDLLRVQGIPVVERTDERSARNAPAAASGSPADHPLGVLQSPLVDLLVRAIEPGIDVIVPVVGGFYEPLCAVYSKGCLPAIESQLERGDYKISRFFDLVALKTIDEETIRSVDDRLHSFLNVNAPEDYDLLKRLSRT